MKKANKIEDLYQWLTDNKIQFKPMAAEVGEIRGLGGA